MSARTFGGLFLLGILGIGAFGAYGWWNARKPDELAEEMTAETPVDEQAPRPAPAVVEERLALNLKVGDRFPLLKTVDQNLRQPTPQGWITSNSRLEMLLHLTLEEIYHADPGRPDKDPREGQKRLQVKYHRIRFSQTVPGRNISYDSDAPPNPIPLEAQGYHGLKDNSFQFWIGADNQILQMVGFEPFLDRCLRDVAPEQRQAVRTMLASTSGADGIANFVDDSIGLLPAEAVRVDDTWSRSRQLHQPVPMHIDCKYTLRQINPRIADVDIVGTITPSSNYTQPVPQGVSAVPGSREVTVVVRGGNCFGSCQIDRRTGLPIFSKVQQSMRMNVIMAGGIEFDQSKTTVTTISTFPEQSSGVPALIASPRGAQPVAEQHPPLPVDRTAAVPAAAVR